MVKHIVLFKFKPFNSESERLTTCEKIKSELTALVEKVPTLLTAEVGINCNPNEQFDIALTTTHNDGRTKGVRSASFACRRRKKFHQTYFGGSFLLRLPILITTPMKNKALYLLFALFVCIQTVLQ